MTFLDSAIFLAGKFIGALLLPPLSLLLLAAVGVVAVRHRPMLGRWLIGLSLGAFWLLATPLVANRLAALVEVPCAPVKAGEAEAIVILGGGMRRMSPEYGGGATLKPAPLERVRYAAWVYRETGAPILVSGGSPEGWEDEACLMRVTLEKEFGVPVTWVEDQSRTTRENAEFSARLLKNAGIQRIYLVSHAWHLHRAIFEFEQQGLTVIPAGTVCESVQPFDWPDIVPDQQALVLSRNTFHELLGLVWYRLIHLFI